MNSCIMKWTSSCVILKDDLSFKHNPSQFIFIIITYYPQYTYIVDPLLEAGQAIIVVRIPLDFRFILFIVLTSQATKQSMKKHSASLWFISIKVNFSFH